MNASVAQVDLRSGTTVRTCWVEPKVKPGDRITLKNSEDPRRWWDVVRVSAPRSVDQINRGWNNSI